MQVKRVFQNNPRSENKRTYRKLRNFPFSATV
jgi:hypothetical protein